MNAKKLLKITNSSHLSADAELLFLYRKKSANKCGHSVIYMDFAFLFYRTTPEDNAD